MLPEHIIEREDLKTLNLLAYALDRSGVSRIDWRAAMSFDDLGTADNAYCLFREGGWWKVSYTERGGWREDGRFLNSHNAVQFMYLILSSDKGPFNFREDWEHHTGQEFSMVD